MFALCYPQQVWLPSSSKTPPFVLLRREKSIPVQASQEWDNNWGQFLKLLCISSFGECGLLRNNFELFCGIIVAPLIAQHSLLHYQLVFIII